MKTSDELRAPQRLSPWVPQGLDAQLQRVGVAWDAVRAPAHLGDRVLTQLGSAQGAVIRDGYRHNLFWLVPLASAAGWKPIEGVEAYGPTCWLEVPPAGRTRGLGLYWERQPRRGRRLLTNPGALHGALARAVAAANGSHPGGAS